MPYLQIIPRRHDLARRGRGRANRRPVHVDQDIGPIVHPGDMAPLLRRDWGGSGRNPPLKSAKIYGKLCLASTDDLEGVTVLLRRTFPRLLDDRRTSRI